jgi:hypothetical protein
MSSPYIYLLYGIGANLLACLIIWGSQELEARAGLIPKRHSLASKDQGGLPMLYCQDMAVFLVGDLIGLSIINASFFYYFSRYVATNQLIILTLAIFLFDLMFLYLEANNPNHRPDAGSPGNGRLSITGWFHFLYHGYFVSVTVTYIIMQCFLGLNTISMTVFAIGGVIWLGAGLYDLLRGTFQPCDKLKRSRA